MSDALLSLRRELATLTAKKRADRILERKDAMLVVRALPALDVYATVREIGLEDTLEILELASPKQVQAFLDLDGWRGDRVDPSAISMWLRALFAANPDRAVNQMRGLDLEMITLLFKMNCQVVDISAEEDVPDDVGLHSITPDQRYLILYGGVVSDDGLQMVLKELIERLMGRDMLFVLRLCEAVRWELPSSLEEASLRWRNARMADLGFLPRHEALAVFAYLDPDADLPPPSAQATGAHADVESTQTDLSTSVVLPHAMFSSGQTAFGEAVRGFPLEQRERAAHELMLTANRVHAAEGGDVGDPEALRATVQHTMDTIGVALSYRSQGDPRRLSALLASTSMQALFRTGHSLAVKLQRELRARIEAKDSGLAGNGLLHLDSPLRETAAGLLRTRPVLYGGLLDPKRVDYRPCASLAELAALARAVSEMAFRAALFGTRTFGAPDGLDALLARAGVVDKAALPSHGALLATLLLRGFLGEALTLVPVTPAQLARAHAQLRGKDVLAAGAATIDALLVPAARFPALPGAPTSEDVQQRLRLYASQVWRALTDELGRVEDIEPDARFLSAIWTSA